MGSRGARHPFPLSRRDYTLSAESLPRNVKQYTTSGSNIGNSFVHLVNNTICKKSDNFGRVRSEHHVFV